MTTSATRGRRAAHRRLTARRIHVCAQELADRHGLDGFSMDDLAAAADVSRRTLFNYFPGKEAAVLGDDPVLDPELTAEFVSGGPTGQLADDLVILIERALAADTIDAADLARLRRLMAAEPRLMTLIHRRFEEMSAELSGLIATREGADHDDRQSRVVIHVLAALFDLAMTDFVEDPRRPFSDAFRDAVGRARIAFN